MITDTAIIDIIRESEMGIYQTVKTDTITYMVDQGRKTFIHNINGVDYFIYPPKEFVQIKEIK